MRLFLAALALLCALPASAQTITGCASVASNRVATSKDATKLKADADCFGRAKVIADAAAKVRLDRIAALTPTPQSSLDPSAFLWTGGSIPASGKPDVVGAFRLICQASHNNSDDPIIAPGVKGGSPHGLHTWFGNTRGDYSSTYASLRAGGDSTCMNVLNRSAYWVPSMLTAAGKIIMPDYISLYYKRRPASDPQCLVEAEKGCVGLPTGLRVVSGYDMKRMGQAQPENQTFHWRCISPNRPSDHRATITEALTDCGGAGQIMASISFGGCWNGQLDSPDHRGHLAFASYGQDGVLRCPTSHAYLIPELTQSVAYTIAREDGAVRLSSDMGMPAGSTMHADYMEAWDPATRDTWTANCIDKLLNCSDGELGNGTGLKRWAGFGYVANPRVVDAPTQPL